MWVEKHGATWRIRDRLGDQKVTVADGYRTKTAAKAAKTELQADKQRGDSLVPRGGRTTLADWVAAWLPHYTRSLKPSSALSEGARIRNHILPLLGPVQLDNLDSMAVQRWIDDLGKGVGPVPDGATWRRRPLAPKTVHNCHGLLHTILAAAVGQRLIRTNPCSSSTLPSRVHREMMFLTDPQINRLVSALPAHWRPLVLLLVATGLRWGEAVGLRAGRVDLLAARPKLVVLEQMQELSGTGELVFVSPKSAKSRRTVSFTRQVAMVLAPLVGGKEPGELVFGSPRGLPVRTRNFRRVWLAACRQAGLEGLRVHDLRHTHAAILISAGQPLMAISRRLGHSSVAVTDLLYGHLREEVDEGIIAAIERAMAGVGAGALDAEVDAELAEIS
jgi:integrase